jgi:protein tyrosine/serine phosphatase
VHCDSGADRAGFVSALFLAEIEKRPAEEAARQLSIVYGHFPYLIYKTAAMDDSFWAFVEAHSSAQGYR